MQKNTNRPKKRKTFGFAEHNTSLRKSFLAKDRGSLAIAPPAKLLLARMTDKPLVFQETIMTKPRRCDKKENINKCTYDAVDDCTASMARDHAGQVHAKRNGCSRRFKHHAITRKVKHINSIIGPTSMIAVEQQPTSPDTVTAKRAATSDANLMNL
jgi:hypothetical protein